jgi:N-acylneuraminate cytidylyltransferase/CMP-N,N'-diacetyllegionaminic acid synthase
MPVIAWTIEAALQSGVLDRVIVSTDDREIARVARRWGADVPFMRPKRLARDRSGHMDVVLHAVRWLEGHESYCPDYVLLLQPTSPLRSGKDIALAVALIAERDADGVISVCETHHHPLLMRRVNPQGWLADFVLGAPAAGSVARLRQNLAPAYFENGAIYLVRRSVLLSQRTFCPARTIPYIMPPERSLQIDDAWGLRLIRSVAAEGAGLRQGRKKDASRRRRRAPFRRARRPVLL